MNRTYALLRKLLLFTAVVLALAAQAQTRYWVGGDGTWSDRAHRSDTPGGPGGAGVPDAMHPVIINATTDLHIILDGPAHCAALSVDAASARLSLSGPPDATLSIAGGWSARGDVRFDLQAPITLAVRRQGVEVDLRGADISGDLVLDGSGSWSVISDLDLAGDLRLVQGTLIANAARIKANGVVAEGGGRGSIFAGRSIWDLTEMPQGRVLRDLLQATTTLVVGGVLQRPDTGSEAVADRGVNICGTDPGQTPFTVDAQVVTNYNSFGVSCRGECDGTVTVLASGGSGNFAYNWFNGGPTTATWTTACGGPQIVVVTDLTQGISCPVQVNLLEPPPLGVIFFGQGTPPTCADVCNGTRTALAVGGAPPATYNWNNGAGSSSSFSQLCAGLNTLLIRDANQCTFDTTFFFNVQPIVPNLTFTNVNCFGACDGTASVAPSGGTGNYTITWTPAPPVQGGLSVNGLCAGDYSVRIADSNSCDTTVTFTITEPTPFTVATTLAPATCANTCDGSASVTVSGSAGPYSYLWAPAPGAGQGTNSATGLCAGTYTVLVTDVPTGCDTLVSVIITAPPAFTVQATVTDASCSNTCDGIIGLAVSGGTPGYTFLWSPPPPAGQGTSTASGLCPGDWSVTITDLAGCDSTLTYTVGAPPPLVAQLSTVDASCAGICDGEASVTVSGGTSGYTFLWTPSPPSGQGSPAASGLCAGPYTLLVSDANGCDTTIAFVIEEPLPLTATQSQTNLTCGATCDGTAAVVVSGGTTDYTYLWTPAPAGGQGTPNATGLCAGNVSVLITDANGCTLTVPFVIGDAVPIQLSLQLTPASCPGTCDGAAGVIVSGGVPNYTYTWTPAPGGGQGTANVTGLCPQAYSLTVTDAVGCDTTISFTITAPLPIADNATITDATCAGDCNGIITLAPTGGNGTFTYQWSPAPPIGQGSSNVAGLCAGDWSVTITSGSCDTTITYTIAEPLPITADLITTDPSCAGACDGTATVNAAGGTGVLSYVWTPAPTSGQGTANASGFCPGPHQVSITDAAGCDTTITFTILAPLPIVATLTTTPETCAGPCTGTATLAITGGTGTITIDWQPAPGGGQGSPTATGLCAGTTYSVALTDANGCDTTLTFTIAPSAVIVPNISSTPVSCNGSCDGTATTGPSGGTPPYSYTWSPPPPVGQGTPSVSGLCPGTYQVSIVDDAGCTVVAEVLITEPPPIITDAVITNPLCAGVCDGSIALSTAGGAGVFTYTWSPQPPAGQGTNTITGLCAGTWNVVVSDAAGCSQTASYTITEPDPLTLSVTTTPSQCQVCIGAATATFAGGSGSLSVEWVTALGASVGNTATVTDLCAGIYLVTVRDANGCSIQQLVPITDSNGEVLTTTNGTTSCPNTCDGSVAVDFVCADPACTVQWSDADGNVIATDVNTVPGLCPGSYFVSVTNASGCISIDTATVVAPVVLTLNISSSPASCAGACDGEATIGVADGTPPYTFLWTPAPPVGQGTPVATGLCAGAYEVAVTDGNGC
ncbi:MAG: SprB repeat-containing protein, partial [Flavobacteriales bacterium]